MASVGDEFMETLRNSYLLCNFTGPFEKLQKDQLVKAYLRLLLVVNSNNKFVGDDESDGEISKHILRCLSLCELRHLVGSGGTKVLFSHKVALKVLSGLHIAITAKHGANASQRTRMAMKAEDIGKSRRKRNPLLTDAVTVKENIPEEELPLSAPFKGKELHRTPVRPQNSNEYEDNEEDDTSLSTPKHKICSDETPIKYQTAKQNMKSKQPSNNIKSDEVNQTFDEKPIKSASSMSNQMFDEKPIKSASSMSNQTFDEKPIKSASSMSNQTFDEKPIKSASSMSNQTFDEKPIKSASFMSNQTFDEKPIKSASSMSNQTFDEKPIKSASSTSNQTFDEESMESASSIDQTFDKESVMCRVDYDERPIKPLDTKMYYTASEDNVIDEIDEQSCDQSDVDSKSPDSLANNYERKDDHSSTEDSNSSKLSEQGLSSDEDLTMKFKAPLRTYKATTKQLNTQKDKRQTFVIEKQPDVSEGRTSLDYPNTPCDQKVSCSENMDTFTIPNLDFLPANATYICTPSEKVIPEIIEKISPGDENLVEKNEDVPCLNLSIEESPKIEGLRSSKSLIVDSCESSLNESSMNIFPRNRNKDNAAKLMAKAVAKKLSDREGEKLNEMNQDDNSLVIVNRAATRRPGKTITKTEPSIKINKKERSDNKTRKKKDIEDAGDAEDLSNDIVKDNQTEIKIDSPDTIDEPTKKPLKKSRRRREIKEPVALTNSDAESPICDTVEDTLSKPGKDASDLNDMPTKEPPKKSRKKKIEVSTNSVDSATSRSRKDPGEDKAKQEPLKKSRKKRNDEENEILDSVDDELKSEVVKIKDKNVRPKMDEHATERSEPPKKLRKMKDSVAADSKPDDVLENNTAEQLEELPKKRGRKPATKKNQLTVSPVATERISKKKEVNMDTEENDDTKLTITNSEDLRATGRRRKKVNYCELTPSSKPKKGTLQEIKEAKSVDLEKTDQKQTADSNELKPTTLRGRKKTKLEDDNDLNIQGSETKTAKGGRKKKTEVENKAAAKRGRKTDNEVEEEESPPKSRKVESKPAGKSRKTKVEKVSPEIPTRASRTRRVQKR